MRRLFPVVCVALACGPAGEVAFQHDFSDDAAFWDAPLPSTHRTGADGTVRLDGFPNPSGVRFVTQLTALADGHLRGAGVTAPIALVATGRLPTEGLPDYADSVLDDAPAFLVDVDPASPDHGVRHPVRVATSTVPGPFGAPHTLAMLPLQGAPLRAETTYAAVVLRALGDADGEVLLPAAPADAWRHDDPLPDRYAAALDALDALGVDPGDVAGLAVFRTQDPLAELRALADAMRDHRPELEAALTPGETFDDYCVYNGVASMPVYQRGRPPFRTEGGDLAFEDGVPVLQGTERANVVVTIPRGEMPAGGWPVAVFVRTGGGGDRPLVDRGWRPAHDQPALEPGSGPARDLAWAGFAAISVDGPHGGLRNVTGGDEQFLMFNVLNPAAMRDNVRQSAAELTLLPDLLDTLTVDTTPCGGGEASFDGEHIALVGHSMGATIAPLTLAAEPRYGAAILSGFGGSWIHNILHKRSPLEVRPLAEQMLGYPAGGLHEHDPALALLQWAGESADPPVVAHALAERDTPVHVYMAQGIVDTYILPPIANAGALSLGLDLAGDPLDEGHPGLADFTPLAEQLPLVGGRTVPLPARGNRDGRTAIVVQHLQDDIEDGHEVYFQTDAPKHQARCFLRTWVDDGVPTVPVAGDLRAPCD